MRLNPPIFFGTLILFAALVAAGIFGYLLSQLIRGFLSLDGFTVLVTLFLLAAIVLLIYALVWLVKRQQSPPVPRSTESEPIELPVEAPFVRRRRKPRHPSQSLPDSELQDRLIRMLGGDRITAEGLVYQVKQNHPGRPEDWYWHKAIEDLERNHREHS